MDVCRVLRFCSWDSLLGGGNKPGRDLSQQRESFMSGKDSKGELKPCPFCGSKPEIVSGMEIPPTVEEYLEQEPIVKCSKVGCALRYTTVLLDEWNTRPITPKEEWISVCIGLPNIGDKVDVLHKYTKGHLSGIFIDNGNQVCWWEDLSGKKYPFGEITYWRPSPPNDQTEKEGE